MFYHVIRGLLDMFIGKAERAGSQKVLSMLGTVYIIFICNHTGEMNHPRSRALHDMLRLTHVPTLCASEYPEL